MSQPASAVALTPAQLRTMGSASVDQRNELRALLQTKRYPRPWRDRLFADIREQRGLSNARAASALNWLRAQPDRGGDPPYCSPAQAEDILELLRVRLTPSPIARRLREQIDAGILTVDQADLALKDLRRLPLREFPLPGAAGKVNAMNVPDGLYALAGSDARTRHYRVTTDVVGAREVKQLNGPRRQRLIRTASQVNRILQQIAVDPAAAAKLYAEETKQCANCNRPLRNKDQPGYPHGYGPDCWEEIEAARKINEHKATIPDAD